MNKKKTTIYTIPVEDKYIIYAPLLPLAFIGNKALVNMVNKKQDDELNSKESSNELITSLEKHGLFRPDQTRFPACDCNKPFNPTLCILMPTTACNLACTYCYAAYEGKKNAFMSWPIAKKAIDIAFENARTPQNGRFSLSFHGGGEPTLPKEFFFKATKYARDLDPNCPVSITTNAVWDKEYRDKILDIVSEVSISFDGNEFTQNRQRPDMHGNDTFSKVMESIKEIEKRKIPYGIRMTVTKESLPELRSNIEFICSETECKSLQVEAVYNMGRAIGAGLSIDDIDTFVETFMDVHQIAEKNGRSVHYSSARPHVITNTFCTATSTALIVTSDGELTACYEVFDHSHLLADNFIIGKIDLNEGIVLYPEKRTDLLKKIAENKDSCKDCFCYFHCAGDCPPKAFISHLNNDQFRCTITRAITRELIIDRIFESEEGIWHGNIKRKEI
jgi:uncharacterized protein